MRTIGMIALALVSGNGSGLRWWERRQRQWRKQRRNERQRI